MTTTPPTTTDPSPLFYECHITLQHWHNRSAKHENPLVSPAFLTEIEAAMELCRRWVREETLPTLRTDCRLLYTYRVLPDGTLHTWNDVVRQLERAISTLKSQWTDVLGEAEVRLGRRFRISDYPAPSALSTLWKAELKVDLAVTVSTLALLKEYSRFFKPPKEPDILEAIAYGRLLEKELAKPAKERKLPPWPPDGSHPPAS